LVKTCSFVLLAWGDWSLYDAFSCNRDISSNLWVQLQLVILVLNKPLCFSIQHTSVVIVHSMLKITDNLFSFFSICFILLYLLLETGLYSFFGFLSLLLASLNIRIFIAVFFFLLLSVEFFSVSTNKSSWWIIIFFFL